MDSKTYYLKYRPQNFQSLDLPEIAGRLEKLLNSKNIPHAFLFAGQKGTGKTSAARILAKTINCQGSQKPCNQCDVCQEITKGSFLDLIEIDAASNRGIDDIRELKDKIKLSPARAKYKVYIIDEVHMLTTEAFNALLKTLEEPPAHAVFVLCTTAPEKLPETIISRCLRFNFRKAKIEEIINSLERVVKGEKLKVKKEVLAEIAAAADGSFRDGHKLLDQLVLEGGEISLDKVQKFLGNTSDLSPQKLLSFLAGKELKPALAEIDKVFTNGADPVSFATKILDSLRQGLLSKIGVAETTEPAELKNIDINSLRLLISLFARAVGEIKYCPISQLPFELVAVDYCSLPGEVGPGEADTPPVETKPKTVTPKPEKQTQPSRGLKNIEDKWGEILLGVRPLNHSVEALLRACRPLKVDNNTLTLEVFYKFHKERLETEKCRGIVEEVVSQIVGSPLRLACVLGEKKNPPRQEPETKEEASDILEVANGIFNGKIN